MPCPCCTAARETSGLWRYFELSCMWCGARLIQQIPKYSGTDAETTQRRRAVLKDWVAYGHSEQEIRALAALKTLAFEPVTKGRT